MKIKKTKPAELIGGLINYLAAVALAVIFALYLSGRVGWFLVTAFVAAPIISVLMTLIFVSRIYVSCDADMLTMCKGDSCVITVSVTNGTFLPTPPVLVDMTDTPAVEAESPCRSISVLPFDTESFEVSYKAKICGPANIGVKSIRVTDYFGFVSFEIKSADISQMTFTAAVIPDIPDVTISDPVVSRAAELAAFSDDSEETVEAQTSSFGGFPGYENREYVPGDPLKRVNWKQSAKRGKLLVRLDDETVSSAVTVILDSSFDRDSVFIPTVISEEKFSGGNSENITCLMAQDAVEQSLGITRALMLGNFSVNFYLTGKNGWECFPAADENDLAAIRTELASYSYAPHNPSRFPEEELKAQKSSVAVFCTPYLDPELNGIVSHSGVEGKGTLQTVIYPSAVSPKTASPQGGMNDER